MNRRLEAEGCGRWGGRMSVENGTIQLVGEMMQVVAGMMKMEGEMMQVDD